MSEGQFIGGVFILVVVLGFIGFLVCTYYENKPQKPIKPLKTKADFLMDLKRKVEEIPDTIVSKRTHKETIKSAPYSEHAYNIPVYNFEYKSNQDKKLKALKIYAAAIKDLPDNVKDEKPLETASKKSKLKGKKK